MEVKGSCCVIDCSGLTRFQCFDPKKSEVGFTRLITGFLFNFSFQWYPITYIASVLFQVNWLGELKVALLRRGNAIVAL